ncbi:hypothetical protein [Allofournierella massiliensis]|uniref:Uncharacterized protein n=1 Tax=Allofournierella massiliensis TaxID=1650663 RepID=A0ABT7UN31_9FIRM|nr:hypothetical protein [Fournierella massiliensis]MDM8200284.1 hypothetical protein [Fournierella massiliensis]
MQKQCQDNYWTTFKTFGEMHSFHEQQAKESQWHRCKVSDLHVEPLDQKSPLFGNTAAFALGTSSEAIADTAKHLGLAISVDGQMYPVRGTAYKSLLDRAKISGSVLPKLSRDKLARTLNDCLELFSSEALVLIRDEKVSAAHSGDPTDYSVLPIDQLLDVLESKLQARFPGAEFESGYCDHALASASWTMPAQKDDLLGAYEKMLASSGKAKMAAKLVPGIRFITSDTGIASAKVSALLMGTQYPIHIGSCVAVDHRHQTTVGDFEASLDQLFAQFADSVKQLQHLLEIPLDYPVNAMTRVCKKLALPKKAAVEAIAMFEMAYGGGAATAHDVFMAMQEIPCILKSSNTPESKMLSVEENLARALTLRWSDYDLAKAVNY